MSITKTTWIPAIPYHWHRYVVVQQQQSCHDVPSLECAVERKVQLVHHPSCFQQRPSMTFQRLSKAWWFCLKDAYLVHDSKDVHCKKYHWLTTKSEPSFVVCTIWSCWSFLQSPNSSDSQTRLHAIGTRCGNDTRRLFSIDMLSVILLLLEHTTL